MTHLQSYLQGNVSHS